MYATNALGEVLPPMFIFDSSVMDSENFLIMDKWVKDLPAVRGKYGCPMEEDYSSFVCVHKSGCTGEELFKQYYEVEILPLFPNVSPECVRDENRKLLRGPIVTKVDSGQGRLVATVEAQEFREKMARLGVIILLGLPNSTSVSQELNQTYQMLKVRNAGCTPRLYGEKIARHAKLLQRLRGRL